MAEPDQAGTSPDKGLLTPAELAIELGVAVGTLKQWRYEGKGPAYIRLNARLVRYPVADVDAWLATRTRVEPPGAKLLAALRAVEEGAE